MLTDRQLADMATDADAVLTNPRNPDTGLAVMARHVRYLLDEVERLKTEVAIANQKRIRSNETA